MFIKNDMPQLHYYLFFITAAFPILIGAVYYHPKILGRTWLSTADISSEVLMVGSRPKILLLSYLFGLFMSYVIFLFAVHQSSIYQLFLHDKDLLESGTGLHNYVNSFMDDYGDKHRTFGHGVIHGMELCLLMGLAMIGTTALREQRSMKYVWIHVIFWVICGGAIGGVLCAYV